MSPFPGIGFHVYSLHYVPYAHSCSNHPGGFEWLVDYLNVIHFPPFNWIRQKVKSILISLEFASSDNLIEMPGPEKAIERSMEHTYNVYITNKSTDRQWERGGPVDTATDPHHSSTDFSGSNFLQTNQHMLMIGSRTNKQAKYLSLKIGSVRASDHNLCEPLPKTPVNEIGARTRSQPFLKVTCKCGRDSRSVWSCDLSFEIGGACAILKCLSFPIPVKQEFVHEFFIQHVTAKRPWLTHRDRFSNRIVSTCRILDPWHQ